MGWGKLRDAEATGDRARSPEPCLLLFISLPIALDPIPNEHNLSTTADPE